MSKFYLKDDFIKLGQLLKASGLIGSGAEAKLAITGEKVKLNGAVETQRGKKIHEGDIVSYNGQDIKVVKNVN